MPAQSLGVPGGERDVAHVAGLFERPRDEAGVVRVVAPASDDRVFQVGGLVLVAEHHVERLSGDLGLPPDVEVEADAGDGKIATTEFTVAQGLDVVGLDHGERNGQSSPFPGRDFITLANGC